MLAKNIQIVSAPSILGLKLTGVEKLGEKLLSLGLAEKLKTTRPVIYQKNFNAFYSTERNKKTKMINEEPLQQFSILLSQTIQREIADHFLLVLGGDCSILIGIMAGMKNISDTGLIFLDAHADFYQPEASMTGEAADMDLAIVSGRGPDILTNIGNNKPYVMESNVIHIGQRDQEETEKYVSQQIQDSLIRRWDLNAFRKGNFTEIIHAILSHMNTLPVNCFWIHFDADVLDDAFMPAVDYRLQGGLSFQEVTGLLSAFMKTGKISGMSVTIYNPELDKDGTCSRRLVESIVNAFN